MIPLIMAGKRKCAGKGQVHCSFSIRHLNETIQFALFIALQIENNCDTIISQNKNEICYSIILGL